MEGKVRIQTCFSKEKERWSPEIENSWKFSTAIIDPDWPYTVAPGKERLGEVEGLSWKGRLSGFTRNRDNEKNIYKKGEKSIPLSIKELKELPIREVVGGYIFLWTVVPFLINGDALEIIKAWGFEPCSMITWAKYDLKNNHGYGGVGYWFLGNAEFCIVAKNPEWPSIRTGYSSLMIEPSSVAIESPSLFIEPKTRHSSKPRNVHELCEKRFPAPYLEIFGRDLRAGWTVLGNEVTGDGKDIRESLGALL